jgi:hypothetical protein
LNNFNPIGLEKKKKMMEEEEEKSIGGGSFEIIPLSNQEQSFLPTIKERISHILYSKNFWIFYVFMISISIIILIWTIYKKGHPREWWFIILEGFLILLMVTEISLRILVKGFSYFNEKLNIFDFIVTTLCLISFIIFIFSVHKSINEEIDEFLESFMMIFRFK